MIAVELRAPLSQVLMLPYRRKNEYDEEIQCANLTESITSKTGQKTTVQQVLQGSIKNAMIVHRNLEAAIYAAGQIKPEKEGANPGNANTNEIAFIAEEDIHTIFDAASDTDFEDYAPQASEQDRTRLKQE